MNTCNVCYRAGSVWEDAAGCRKCKGRTQKSCERCEDQDQYIPCVICYPGRNFRWAALRTAETGTVPGRFERNEFCEDCLSFLCDCNVSDYEEAIFKYLGLRSAPVVEEEESPMETETGTSARALSQITEAEWSHPLTELPHQTVIKGVSFCKHCWRTLASTASGCYCAGAAECSCSPTATEFCPACCHDRDLRKVAAMDFLAAP